LVASCAECGAAIVILVFCDYWGVGAWQRERPGAHVYVQTLGYERNTRGF
jgi:hypothetical protein